MFRAIVSGPIFLMYIDMSAIAVANVFQVESVSNKRVHDKNSNSKDTQGKGGFLN